MKIKIVMMISILLPWLVCCNAEPATSKSDEVQTSPIPTETEHLIGNIDEFEPVFEETECLFPVPPNRIEGENVLCGFVVVPQKYYIPSGDSIKLSIVIFKITSFLF